LAEDVLSEEKALAIIIASYHNRRTNILEKAKAFTRLFEIYGSAKKVSQITGLDQRGVDRFLNVNKLPAKVKILVGSRKIKHYYVAAELLSISNRDRLIETAYKIQGLPREVALEAIRYVKKNENISVNECIDELMTFYQQYINIKVYIFKKAELFENNNINFVVDSLEQLFMKRYFTKLKISNILGSEDIIFMLEKNEYMNHGIKNFKQILLKCIGEVENI